MTKYANFYIFHNVEFNLRENLNSFFISVFDHFNSKIEARDGASKILLIPKSGKVALSDVYYGSISDLDNPAESWGCLCNYNDSDKTLIIGYSDINKIQYKENFELLINSLGNFNISFFYGYYYFDTLPYGQCYALGFYCTDSKHDITDFMESRRVNSWMKKLMKSKEIDTLRDLHEKIALSSNFYETLINDGKYNELFEAGSPKKVNSEHVVLDLSESQISELRKKVPLLAIY